MKMKKIIVKKMKKEGFCWKLRIDDWKIE